MEFTIDDVVLLYGDCLYRVPDPGEAPQLLPTTPVEWRQRPTGRITLILTHSDFHNRELTGFLRELILRSGVPTEHISFGICGDEGVAPVLLTDMPSDTGICFASVTGADADGVWRGAGHTLYPAPGLTQLKADIQAQQMLVALLAGLK